MLLCGVVTLAVVLLKLESQIYCNGQLHSPLLSGPVAGGGQMDGSQVEQVHVGHCKMDENVGGGRAGISRK